MSYPELDTLKKLGPCADALAWAASQPNAAIAWAACQRGDWMLWLVGRIAGKPGSTSRKLLVRAAHGCAMLAPNMKSPRNERVRRQCLSVIKKYLTGETTLKEVRSIAIAYSDSATAYAAAYAAAHAAAYAAAYGVAHAAYAASYAEDAAAYAAYAAAYVAGYAAYAAAYASYAAAYSGNAAIYAGYAAAYAGDAAAYGAADASGVSKVAYKNVLAACANIVREYYPHPPNLNGTGGNYDRGA